jgi:hypothetical protein
MKNLANEHRRLQRQYQRDLTLSTLGLLVATLLIVGGIVFVFLSVAHK